MADVSSLAGDVAGAGAALAGLTLVFVGHTGAAFLSHPDKQALPASFMAGVCGVRTLTSRDSFVSDWGMER